jgi:hypothetical protein
MKTPMKLKLFGRFKDARNALKLTYEHLKFQKVSGLYPRTPKKGEGRGGERRGGEGRGEERRRDGIGEGKGKVHLQT